MRLAGKVAIVLPGTFGIGHEISRGFAAEGAKVLVAGYSEKNGRATAEAIEAAGGEARFSKTDLFVDAEVGAAVAEARRAWGRVDVAVGVPDYHAAGLCHETSLESFDASIRYNARSLLLLSKHAIPAILESAGGGAVVFLSSIYGLVSGSVSVGYETAKSMALAMTKSLGERYGGRGVRVNCIVAGHVRGRDRGLEPEMGGTAIADAAEAQRLGQFYPQKRIAEPEEIVRAAVFLASEEAGFVNAAALNVDGGFVAR
jgi:NAD(P)-dependent dehydrogenase (short-subunit alcohol dehydrogenase family)